MDKEEIKKQFKEYLRRSFVPEMWYGASTESWDRIVDGFFDYYQPERLNPEDRFAAAGKVICDSLNTTETP